MRLLLLASLAVSSLQAQTARVAHKFASGDGALTVEVTVSGGSSHGFGLGFARVDVENTAAQAQGLSIELTPARPFRGDVSSQRKLLVMSGKQRFFLPIAIPPVQCRLVATIAGAQYVERIDYRRGNGLVSLFLSDRSGRASHGVRVLSLVPSVIVGEAPEQVVMQSQDLPTDWRLLTSFSMIVVDGDGVYGAGMSGELQEALRRYAYAGGTVVVSSPDSLPAGALREVATQALDGMLRHGLGNIVALDAFGQDSGKPDAGNEEQRLAELPPLGTGLWPATRDLFPTQDIAGLGEAPVRAFLLIIFAFAILVGPVNFWILRRRKQPLLALLTVPVMGFGTTIVILSYGVFHDGFAVRGVARSCTVLDQQRHVAVCVQASTLFAGRAPNAMTMAPDTMLLSARAGTDVDEWPDRWHWDADRQLLDGGILPSRTTTPLLSVQQGPVRERLTVKKSGDTLEVLLDGGLQPVGEVVLCDLDGRYWSGLCLAGKPGVLRHISAAEGQGLFELVRDQASIVRAERRGVAQSTRVPFCLPPWGGKGTFATRVQEAPWLDSHGVDVDYDHADHFVFGRLHAQDFVQ